MKKAILALALVSTSALAQMGEPKYGAVVVESKAAGDNLEFHFRTEPKDGMAINLEGPWKLELKTHEGLTFAKTTFTRAELDEKTAGYKFATTAKPAKPEGELEYSFTTFVCTKDKTQCFREVHKGKAGWKVAAK